MARYILIDNRSGYIWGDSADMNGKIFTGTPIEFAAALDASNGEHGRDYIEVDRLGSTESGYHVYRGDVNGSEVVPIVEDGQDEDQIESVERLCEYVTAITTSKDWVWAK
jgi:hypothetical protein